MNPKLPGYHIIAGTVILGMGLFAKEAFPHYQGSAPYIQLPCAFIGSVLLPLGTFLALQALLLQAERHRELLVEFISGLAFLPLLLTFYFSTYILVTRGLQAVNSRPNILPQMVESARTSPKLEQRQRSAEYSYQIYGAILAYPLDSNQIVYFVPTEEDKTEYRELAKSDSMMKKSASFVEKITNQLPYLFALYVGTYTAAFVMGGFLLVFKLPKTKVAPKS